MVAAASTAKPGAHEGQIGWALSPSSTARATSLTVQVDAARRAIDAAKHVDDAGSLALPWAWIGRRRRRQGRGHGGVGDKMGRVNTDQRHQRASEGGAAHGSAELERWVKFSHTRYNTHSAPSRWQRTYILTRRRTLAAGSRGGCWWVSWISRRQRRQHRSQRLHSVRKGCHALRVVNVDALGFGSGGSSGRVERLVVCARCRGR